jgi:DNA-binding transcriptional LysR family regulator
MLEIYRNKLMQERTFDPSTSRRNFRVAASDFGQLTILPAFHHWALTTAPMARFTGVPLGRESLGEGLESGEIDLAVGGFPALMSGVIEQTLYEDNYVCLLRRDHPLLSDPITLDTFREARHALVSARSVGHVHQEVEDLLLQIIPPENVRIVSHSFSLAPMLIRQSDLMLTIPQRVAALFQSQLDLVSIAPPISFPKFQVKQYWHERSRHDPGHIWLRHGVVALLARHFP